MIRNAQGKDSEAIRDLLDQLGYPQTVEFIAQKLVLLTDSFNDEVYVYEYEGRVVGFISLHYSVQLAFEKDFCEIGYFVVEKDFRSLKIGDKLESYACERAKERNCCEIFVFSQIKRTDAHRFYLRQGYKQTEKYFEKLL